MRRAYNQRTAMSTENHFLKNTWSHEIPTDGMLARTITRVPLLFWRDSGGEVVALEDRCCASSAG
jgi:phenylpropionate dioxygenase-like ring-hydroxylating dioxygenase large terminal subunit